MKTMLSQIDHIIECRDYRIPLTSRNPMFEDSLAGRERMVVYTKKDLGGSKGTVEDTKVGKKKNDYVYHFLIIIMMGGTRGHIKSSADKETRDVVADFRVYM